MCFNVGNKAELFADYSREEVELLKVTFCSLLHKTKMMLGKIARLTDRGFGFITPDEGDKDLFFHARDLVDVMYDDLKEGEAVNFEVVDGPKGPAASDVKRA